MRSDAWNAFLEAAEADGWHRIIDLFRADPGRLNGFCAEAAGLRLDLSKQPWSRDVGFAAALDLARACAVEAARERLFGGEIVNVSEGRPALHMALRAPDGADFKAAGAPVSAGVEAVRAAMRAYVETVRAGNIRAIVHIGIGGSDLGPRMVWEALKPLEPQIDLRFVANVDPADLAAALAGLDPATTLVFVVSKTFTTQETMANATAARAWLAEGLGEAEANAHLAAASTNLPACQAFGVAPERVFGFEDWVGGRYSVWSAVGLSCAIALGWEAFAELLAGAAELDAHFRSAPLERNLPVLLALAHIFNRNGLDRPTRVVAPYARRLRLLPSYLQQLEMESNGKRVTQGGQPVAWATAAAVFGNAGTNDQHAYFQMLHQGTSVIPVDFIAIAHAEEGPVDQQPILLANAIAQAEALMRGQANAAEPHRDFSGDIPSSFILMDRLTPRALGALTALYEHKTFVEGVIWDINSFDQWGVELGKTLAGRVLAELEGGPAGAHDPSTAALIARLRQT
ncbi:glucose-6-phosphate isomerase [Caulobacter ginsengisoli]|uniref:Glucose-6-phosphate isomerase n=1 Tax=Caulobacter ginsengisoli TaxID=400775 RepID=A0ABU0IWW9_9CAUL|nr:glucose-6-phosphate isomerase [Caulobacter ginsengisoli]MDQ0466518.1 glucose-6-phosphate isomerase [Caulobacter ginsengisoli]